MKNKLMLLTAAVFFSAVSALAADAPPAQNGVQTRPGRNMMTDAERNEQRAKMRSASSREEREKIRAEQHEKMKQRAKEKGQSLPDQPLRGGGMGGQGMGGGMGRGGR